MFFKAADALRQRFFARFGMKLLGENVSRQRERPARIWWRAISSDVSGHAGRCSAIRRSHLYSLALAVRPQTCKRNIELVEFRAGRGRLDPLTRPGRASRPGLRAAAPVHRPMANRKSITLLDQARSLPSRPVDDELDEEFAPSPQRP